MGSGYEGDKVNTSTFNRMYKERRLIAERNGQRFPSYNQAVAQLGDAMVAARKIGFVSPVEFWDKVFEPSQDHRVERDARQLGKAAMKAARTKRALDKLGT